MPTDSTAVALDPENYRFLADYVFRESGIVLDQDKHYLLESRLLPVAEGLQLSSLAALCHALRSDHNSPLRQKVVEAMTTHETSFFRDMVLFDALRGEILPQLMRHAANSRSLNIWSAAASSGQEAYSLAMLLLEARLELPGMNILGSDLSGAILEKAREGRYLQLEVNRGLPVGHLAKYFQREGPAWRIREQVRRMVRFEQFDLRGSMRGKGPFDLVLCRNVLIYFDIPTKKSVLRGLREALRPGGYLVLGSAESTLNLDGNFEQVQVGKAIFYQAPE